MVKLLARFPFVEIAMMVLVKGLQLVRKGKLDFGKLGYLRKKSIQTIKIVSRCFKQFVAESRSASNCGSKVRDFFCSSTTSTSTQ